MTFVSALMPIFGIGSLSICAIISCNTTVINKTIEPKCSTMIDLLNEMKFDVIKSEDSVYIWNHSGKLLNSKAHGCRYEIEDSINILIEQDYLVDDSIGIRYSNIYVIDRDSVYEMSYPKSQDYLISKTNDEIVISFNYWYLKLIPVSIKYKNGSFTENP